MYSYTTFHPSQEGKHILQRAERCCLFLSPQKHQGPASFFCRKAQVFFGALKTKSCLSEASSFCLAEKSTGVGKKMQTANFLCFVSFVRAKEMKSLCGLSITQNTHFPSHHTACPFGRGGASAGIGTPQYERCPVAGSRSSYLYLPLSMGL